MVLNCPRCDSENPASARFCNQCGAAFGLREATPEPAAGGTTAADLIAASVPPTGRDLLLRTVTVLFADIEGSTRLIGSVPPEQAFKLLHTVTDAMARAIAVEGGTVVKRMGDGLLAAFGAPIAQPDHALRACRAGLRIRAEVDHDFASDSAWRGKRPRIRVGLNSGEVAIAVNVAGVGDALDIFGPEVSLTARVEAAAEPDTVLMTHATWRRVEGRCEGTRIGARRLFGFERAVDLYRLDAVLDRPLHLSEATPFVGRAEELAALSAVIARGAAGRGGMCVVVGDAGIGKTRLLEEAKHTTVTRALWLEGHSPPFSDRLSFWPIIEMHRAYFDLDAIEPGPTAWSSLAVALDDLLGPEVEDILPFLAAMLGVALPEPAAARLAALDNDAVRREMLRAVRRLIRALARRRPLVLALEDVQWADQSSLDVIGHVLPLALELPLTVILVMRPEDGAVLDKLRSSALLLGEAYVELRLQQLPPVAGRDLIEALMGPAPERAAIAARVLAKAEGNPFFIEEIVRALNHAAAARRAGGSGTGAPSLADVDALPDTISGVLMARIDRLEDRLRETLRLASVIGRAFLFRVLDAIAEHANDLDRRLTALQRAELIECVARVPELEFMFKHALVQESIYHSVFEERRRALHRRVAECLEALFMGRIDNLVGVLAFHYVRAEMWAKAQEYLLKAADRAHALTADAEALSYFEQALAARDRAAAPPMDPFERASIERKLGQIQFRRGDGDSGEFHLRRALALLGEYDPAGKAGVRLGIAAAFGQHLLRWLTPGRRRPATDTAPLSARDAELVVVFEAAAWSNYFRDEERLLLGVLRVLNYAERIGYAAGLAKVYGALGYVFDSIGLRAIAARYHRSARTRADEADDEGARGVAANTLGFHHFYAGAWDEAAASYEEARRHAKAASDLVNWVSSSVQLGYLCALRGNLTRAFELGGAMVDAGLEVADSVAVLGGLLVQGLALRPAGRVADAEALLGETLERASRMPAAKIAIWATGELAWCRLSAGDHRGATRWIAEGQALLRRHRTFEHYATPLLAARAEAALLQAGEAAGAAALAAARRHSRAARWQGRIFAGATPAALRMQGTVAWLAGRRKQAAALWRASLDAATRLGSPREAAATMVEMGRRLDDAAMLERARGALAELRHGWAALNDAAPRTAPHGSRV